MKMARNAVLAGVLALCCGVSAVVMEIPANGTLYVGGDGTYGGPYNKQGGFIIFNPGSTLVVTQTVALTVWATLIVTNGAATVRYEPTTSSMASISSHMFIRGDGSLNVTSTKNLGEVRLGHADYQPVLEIENLTCDDKVAKIGISGCTLLKIPKSTKKSFTKERGTTWLCGTDMFPDDEEVRLPTGGAWVLANTNAVPPEKTIHVTRPGILMLAPRKVPDTSDIVANYPQDVRNTFTAALNGVATNYNNIVLHPVASGVPQLIFTNKMDFTFAGSLSGTGIVEVTGYRATYDRTTAITVGLTGDSSSFHGTIAVKKPYINLFLGHPHATGEAHIVPVAENSTITGTEGVSAFIESGESGNAAVLAGAGTFTFAGADKTFTNSVTHWYDFSRADMYRYPGEGTTNAQPNAKLDGYPMVERVFDWRGPNLTSLWNRRMYVNSTTLEFASSVYPCRKSGTFAGETMEYLSIPTGASRRMPISDGDGAGYISCKSVPAQLVVMVFGSQYGGGNALIGTANGVLARAGNTVAYGITTNTSHAVWVDGVQVDPTAPNTLNGGWQVISISLDGDSCTILGAVKEVAAPYGGQNYGELMIFSNPVTERQRLEAEIYLAEKWGLSSQYAAASRTRYDDLVHLSLTNRVTFSGSVTVNTGENALRLEGKCSGSVVLAGGTLLTSRSPWTASEIPSAGRIYWLDADDRSTLSLRGDVDAVPTNGRTNEVYAVRDRGASSFEAGKPILYGVEYRKPTWYEASFDGGPVRGWLDFNQYYNQWAQHSPSADPSGNCLRFYEYSDDFNLSTGQRTSTGAAPSLATISTRTAFCAHNTVRGGGTPLLDNISNLGTVWARMEGPGQSLWRNGPSVYANGENRLDGVVINPVNGYDGRPEVYTIRGTGAVNVPFVESYIHSEKKTYEEGRSTILGEMLWYSTALTDDEVAGIESYLMKKWLNKVPKGFADVSGVTVSGAGDVAVGDALTAPRFDASFAGNVAVGGARAFEIAIDAATGEVAGALNAPGAVLDLPSACTINVDFTAPVKVEAPTAYTLVYGDAMAHPVEWTVNYGANVPRNAKIVQAATEVTLLVKPLGLRILLR
ncbi:MAG: hypothetical protein IKO72_01185 [Kiritimatiellae bacterium]|nr:hypothetical protein [Kiritimatiellia bacterium]